MVQRPFLPPLAMPGFPLGTDALGRDIAIGLIHGARVSLLVGLISTLAALAIGVPLGAVAGYAGGRVAHALMRFTAFRSEARRLGKECVRTFRSRWAPYH